MKKVYCSECRYFGHDEWIISERTSYCLNDKFKNEIDSWYDKKECVGNPSIINKDNDCKEFRKKDEEDEL